LQRVGVPDDAAQLVDYLLSDAAKFMTGQVLHWDGGLSSVRGL
jgi:NAD(P)-dependent dehydrogenase (short-subunit alcohol dehydrogenase family)